jgi:hypothetical protein
MKPLGIDLAKLGAEAPALATPPDCPGARLRVTRHDYDQLVEGQERFMTKRQDVPYDGYGDARIWCTGTVAQIPKTVTGGALYYGLCLSCSGLEADNRAMLRERARIKGDR